MGTEDVELCKINEDECSESEEHATSDQRRRPLLYLLNDSKEARRQYLHRGLPLRRAASRNDWEAARTIINEDRKILCAAITRAEETVLHVAAGAKHLQFVKNLLKLMDEEEVELQDCKGNTAFCLAVVAGSLEIVAILMQKNARLPLIRGGQGETPLYMAALFGHAEIAWLLYPLTKAVLDHQEWKGIFFTSIHSHLYGLGLKMFEDDSALAMARDVNDDTALHILARKPMAFLHQSATLRKSYTGPSVKSSYNTNLVESIALKLTSGLWNEILVNLPSLEAKQLIDKPSRLLFEAAELGNFPFLVELIRFYPDLVWEVDEKNRSIFHIAVLNRHANIFNLIHEIGFVKDVMLTFEDDENNNMLHLAATSPPPHRLNPELGGTLIQLQHELTWFEAIKDIMHPYYADMKNSNGLTPQDVFTTTHDSLVKDGEHWMNGIAKSCMLVSLLITIGVFLAAFHVVNVKERGFVSSNVLNISESITLVSSSIATLMFLSVRTSNHGKMGFFCLLPFKLITGLVTLFISMSTMMVAFNGRLFISLPHGLKWLATISLIASLVLVSFFILVQYYKLVLKMLDSRSVFRLLTGKEKYHWLHK